MRAFTVVELMAVVAVAAVLAALAAPSFSELLQRNAQETALDELTNSLTFARNQAISRGQQISICQSADGKTCAVAGDWSNGWIVFVDFRSPSIAATVDTDEQILRVHGALKNNTTVRLREGLVADDSRRSIRFDRTGFLSTQVALSQAIFTICRKDKSAGNAQGLYINIAGRISPTRDTNGNDVQDFPAGSVVEDLSCA